jgi:DNA-binding transcriptional LysR family regulator
LGDFSTAHPEIELELETSDDLRVLGRDADVAIRFLAVTTRRRPSPSARSHQLLHDDSGALWRSWFTAATLDGFERAKRVYFMTTRSR